MGRWKEVKIYIRKSSKACLCGSNSIPYSLIQDKLVRAIICERCFHVVKHSLANSELIFLTFDKNPVLPNFLRRIDNESKAA